MGFVRFTFQTISLPCHIVSGRGTRITVTFKHRLRGTYSSRMELWFEDLKLKQSFAIVRMVSVVVGDKEDYERIKPVAPFVPRKRVTREPEVNIIEGVPPPPLKAIRYIVKLPESPIPGNIVSALSQGNISGIISHFAKSLLPKVLDHETYGRHFKYLLWAEEFRSECVHLITLRSPRI